MALSNWDIMAFGPDGKPCNGVLEGIDGQGSVEIYKNWVYVHHPKMWYEGSYFINDTVASIREGTVAIGSFRIHNICPNYQQAVFTFVQTYSFGDSARGGRSESRFMAGIGCYAYDQTGKKTDKDGYPEFVGVRQETADLFIEWLEKAVEDVYPFEGECKAWFKIVKDEFNKSGGTRFNQGDAYFASALGHDIPATEVGKQKETVLEKIINGMKSEDK